MAPMIVSPSGMFGLELRSEVESRGGREVEYLRPVIVATEGGEVFRAPDRIAGWFRYAVAWDEQDRAWISSADSGTTVLVRSTDGSWSRAAWDPDVAAETIWDASTGEDLPVLRDPPPPEIGREGR